MKILTPIEDSHLSEDPGMVPVLAGLLSAAAASWLFVWGIPRSGVALIVIAPLYMGVVLAATVLGVYAAGNIFRRSVAGVARRTAGAAAWLAPLGVYLRAQSVGAIPMAVLAAGIAVALLYFSREQPPKYPTLQRQALLFDFPPPPPRTRMLPFVGAAFCLEATIVYAAIPDPSTAALFAAIGSGIVVWHAAERGMIRTPPHNAREILSSTLTLFLAFVLTAGAMVWHFSVGVGADAGDTRDKSKDIFPGAGGDYWGVFLWPDVQAQAQSFQAPPLPGGLVANGFRFPVRIPFTGVYWLFQPPDEKPPGDAVQAHGTPDEIGFRSAGRTPLIMEGHQRLLAPIDTASCSQILVEIRNVELGGGLTMELIISDSSVPLVELPLGAQTVPGVLPFQVSGNKHGAEETIRFPIPDPPPISKFDEMTIRFHTQEETVSPRTAIENFILVPHSSAGRE